MIHIDFIQHIPHAFVDFPAVPPIDIISIISQ